MNCGAQIPTRRRDECACCHRNRPTLCDDCLISTWCTNDLHGAAAMLTAVQLDTESRRTEAVATLFGPDRADESQAPE